jgi:ribonuclease BN (tRNA processing enzyme)
VRVQFLGSGDAFGSGGRFQACISVQHEGAHVLVDCGATSLVAMKRLGVDPNAVDGMVISHVHGDHFGGLPFLILDGQFSRRERPLHVVGPPGIREQAIAALEIAFAGSARVERRFEVTYQELGTPREVRVGPFAVTGFTVPHPSGAPAYALRLTAGERTLAYSGDGAWSNSLVEAANGADLFICEAYSYDKPIPHHLSYATLRERRDRLDCKRLILTHLGPEMLGRAVDEEVAEDGLVLTL